MKDDFLLFLCAVCVLLLGVVIGNTIGTTGAKNNFKNEAVKQGHAQWVISDNGSPEFAWKKNPHD